MGEAVAGELERLRLALADRYDVESELGRGGMATVYLAHDRAHDRKVAIKVLLPDLAIALGTERFRREISIAGSLEHPHVLGIIDSGEADGLLYYVMPYVRGESLRARMDREGQLPVEDAVRIAAEAAEALDHAHGKGVLHRDIKPENILLDEDGRVLVADFGIARALTEDQRLTQTGVTLGTPAYMSPEQSFAERDLGTIAVCWEASLVRRGAYISLVVMVTVWGSGAVIWSIGSNRYPAAAWVSGLRIRS